MEDYKIPVYLITGFLESGKTSFIQFTIQQDYFADGEKTLLIACEEGEEEYDLSMLANYNTVLEMIEEPEEFTPEFLKRMNGKYHPERVMIEYNGMWSVDQILQMRMPEFWEIYQIITILDGEHFQLYLNNIKAQAIELLTKTDMIIFNRCTQDSPLALYQRTIKSVNRRAGIVFESEDGEMEPPEEEPPYDLNAEIINIADQDYGFWYIDVQEHPERYVNKLVRFRAKAMVSKRFPENIFVPGRNAMTCCEADIRFIGFLCHYRNAKRIAPKQWIYVTAKVKWEYSAAYKEEGPVLYAKGVTVTSAPEEELVYF